MKPLPIWLVGFGRVGTWLSGVLDSQRERLAARYGLHPTVVGISSARGGGRSQVMTARSWMAS